MGLTDGQHTVRIPTPDYIVRGQDHTIYAPVYLDGALVSPSEGTVSVYDAANTAQVSAAAATITSSIARYTIPAATTTSLQLAVGWRVEWDLTVGGATMLARNAAALVRYPMRPVISDVDLYRRVPALDPSSATVITSVSDYQDYLDEAWTDTLWALIRRGIRPNYIIDPGALRDVHLYRTLQLVFEDLATRLNEAYIERAASYQQQHAAAWAAVSFAYDSSDSGQETDATTRKAGTPTIWLGS